MIYFERSSNGVVSAGTTEDLFLKTDFRAKLKEIQVRYDGNNTTGDQDNSTLRILVDGKDLLVGGAVSLDILQLWHGSGLPATNEMGQHLRRYEDDTNKIMALVLVNLDCPILSRLQISLYNADTTNDAAVQCSIIYTQELPVGPPSR